jgi:hypothetical protein
MARQDDVVKLLVSALKYSLPTFSVVQGVDSNNMPTLSVLPTSDNGTAVAGHENAFMRLAPRSYTGYPTISLATNVDGRSLVWDVVVEADANTAARSVWSEINWATLISSVFDMNIDTNLYIRANGSVPVLGDITSGNLKGTVQTDPRHPNSGQ